MLLQWTTNLTLKKLTRVAVRIGLGTLVILGVAFILTLLVGLIFIFLPWEGDGSHDEEPGVFGPVAPQWFPDGDRIAFSHRRFAYVVDSVGSHLLLIDEGSAYAPNVSPDGSRIAYAAYEKSGRFPWNKSESWEIVVAKPDGSDRRLLTENDTLDHYPVWSPDGTRIFFDSRTKYVRGFYVMAADGSDSSSADKVVDAGGSQYLDRLCYHPTEVTWPSQSTSISSKGACTLLALTDWA